MRDKVLLTGGTGFIGRNILPILRQSFEVVAPTRAELNLLDRHAVVDFVGAGRFNLIVHSANPNPAKNSLDLVERMTEDSLAAYFNLKNALPSDCKMFYLGSGAEYDKRGEVAMVAEEDIGRSIPVDPYGLAKYKMNEDARQTRNIYNLRLFGCYGPTDAKSKFIRDAIDCCLEGRAITIRQDCAFDYLFVNDLAAVIEFLAKKDLRFHDYNVCSGRSILLSEIAAVVAKQMGNERKPVIARTGMNREYTGSNARLLKELPPDFRFTPIEEGIAAQIEWQKGI